MKDKNRNKTIVRIIGFVMLITGTAMIIPWIFSFADGDAVSLRGFKFVCPAGIIAGGIVVRLMKGKGGSFSIREGYITVSVCWLTAILLGAFPYYLSGFADTVTDAVFESTSGFTTTGCSSIGERSLPRGLMLWKALSNWLGGMGILVFVICLLPALGIRGQYLAKAETPGPTLIKAAATMKSSAGFLYLTYIFLTIAELILLIASGKMPVYDAVINTMGSISTGGLTVHPEGVAFYDSLYVEIVISFFCILSALNFVLYHSFAVGQIKRFFADGELRTFLMIIACGIIMCFLGLVFINKETWPEAFRDSGFQVISMATTAGYIRSPELVWPTMCKLVILALVFIGGCSASTSGSVKVYRIIVMVDLVKREIKKRIHPRAVYPIKINGETVPPKLASSIASFIILYLDLLLLSVFVLSFQTGSLEIALTTSLDMLSNTGAAFGGMATLGNLEGFNAFIKLYLCSMMIAGRLELYTVVMMFSKSFWKRNYSRF
ncbi:MAG: TrkH family potassium uptake protein [Bacillota bacterium]|nr:TrkH family potassium uptake protein [Bacillota bacterium]